MNRHDGRVRPPGPDGRPLIGNTYKYVRDPFSFITRCAREYGDVTYYEVAGRPFYQFDHPTDIEHVLVTNNTNYVKGELFQRILGPVTGQGLLNNEGEFWRRQRHLIQPAFHPDRITRYAEVMVEYTERLCAEWTEGETVDVHSEMMGLTFEIIAKTLFDADTRAAESQVGNALEVVMDHAESLQGMVIPPTVPTPANRRYRSAIETLEEVVSGIVAERRSAGSRMSSDDVEERRRADGGEDVVSMLVAARQSDGHEEHAATVVDGIEGESGTGGRTAMTDEQLRDEVMTLLLAGHETTALALSFAFYLLGKHPECEATLVAELDRVLDGRPPTVADLDDLSYTEKVLTESMRLFPPVYGIVREPVEEDVIGGYRVPAGTTIAINQWTVHRDSRWYTDPLAFRPDRWTSGFRESLPRLAYFPFSAGPRRCIGDRFALLEARLVLATVLREWHLELGTATLDLAATITTRPKHAIETTLHRR